MKILDRAAILLLNLCLLFTAILIPALSIAKSPSYFQSAFEKTGLYERIGEDGNHYRSVIRYVNGDKDAAALLSDEQLNAIAQHIISYIRGDTESFELYMDEVYLNGSYTDGVRIFGDAAISHMEDVRTLVNAAEIFAAILACLLPCLLLYLILRRKELGHLVLRYTLFFYATLLLFAVLFVLVTLVLDGGEYGLVRALWRNIHYFLFPFRPDKVNASFFDDALTYILRVDLFMNAVYIILGILTAALSLFTAMAIGMKRCAPKEGKTTE